MSTEAASIQCTSSTAISVGSVISRSNSWVVDLHQFRRPKLLTQLVHLGRRLHLGVDHDRQQRQPLLQLGGATQHLFAQKHGGLISRLALGAAQQHPQRSGETACTARTPRTARSAPAAGASRTRPRAARPAAGSCRCRAARPPRSSRRGPRGHGRPRRAARSSRAGDPPVAVPARWCVCCPAVPAPPPPRPRLSCPWP